MIIWIHVLALLSQVNFHVIFTKQKWHDHTGVWGQRRRKVNKGTRDTVLRRLTGPCYLRERFSSVSWSSSSSPAQLQTPQFSSSLKVSPQRGLNTKLPIMVNTQNYFPPDTASFNWTKAVSPGSRLP